MIENALRRAESYALDVADFLPVGKSLWITGKGRGSQKERVTLSAGCIAAIEEYLSVAGHTEGALFRNLDHRPEYCGARLTADGLYQLIGQYGATVGMKRLTPHQRGTARSRRLWTPPKAMCGGCRGVRGIKKWKYLCDTMTTAPISVER